MHKKFKYTAQFDAVATFNFGKWKEAKASTEVFADLSDLRSLLPSDEEIGENPDLLYTSFNAAVANVINANDHGIATDTALAISKYFVNRQMNLEHDRYEIVGHIISQGFSSFGENKIVSRDSLVGENQPFNISLGAVVYRVAREYVAQFIEESNDSRSPYHQAISTSWEIGFDEFDIVLGSKKIADATIISDEEEKQKYIPYLRMEGGSGMTDEGVPVYCLIKGDARPLGCAFTNNPAAPVKGVFAATASLEEKEGQDNIFDMKEILEQVKSATKESVAQAFEELSKKTENIDEDTSQLTKTNVTTVSMKIKSIDDITPELFANEANASVIKDFISDALSENASETLAQLESEKNARAEAERLLKEANEALSSVKDEISNLKAEILKKEKQEEFTSRMEEIASEFNLSADQSKVVASQIKELDADGFKTWKDQFSVFATKKSATASATEKTEEEKETERLEALKKAEASKGTEIPNSQQPTDKETDYLGILKGMFKTK